MNRAKSEPAHYLWEVQLSINNDDEVLFAATGNARYRKGGGVPVAIHRLPFDHGITLKYFSPPIFNIMPYNRIVSWLTDILNLQAVEENPEEIKTFFNELERAIDERGWARLECIYYSPNKSYEIKIPLEREGKRDTFFSAQTIKSITTMDQKIKVEKGTFEQVPEPKLQKKRIKRPKSADYSRSLTESLNSKKWDRDISSLESRIEGLEKKCQILSEENKDFKAMFDEMRKRMEDMNEEYSSKFQKQRGQIEEIRKLQNRVGEYPDNLDRLKNIWEEKFASINLKMRELTDRTQ